MSSSRWISFLPPFALHAHEAGNLILESAVLKANPLGDTNRRHNYVLVPKSIAKPLPLIFHLSGYFSTGYENFYSKTLSSNYIQQIDELVVEGRAPKAIHVFVEASTFWGGSQFINSPGSGRYADYISKELFSAIQTQFSVVDDPRFICVMGGSSGGYGALSLISQKNSPFGLAFATAPDSFFEASLKPEIYKAAPEIAKYKSFKEIKTKLKAGELQDKKSFFNFINVLAMAHCYAPKESFTKNGLQWPIDLHTGELDASLWKKWLKHDPVHFLPKRIENLQGKEVYLDVGKYDNFSLQFGTRQIAKSLQTAKIKHRLTEFPGGHFGLRARRLLFIEELAKKWKKFV